MPLSPLPCGTIFPESTATTRCIIPVPIDAIKEKQDKLNPDYYTYSEITEKYGLTKINISYYVNKYDITRFKQGSRTMVLRTEFDKVYREHRNGTYTPKKRESNRQQEQKELYNPRRILFVRTDCSHISDDQENYLQAVP